MSALPRRLVLCCCIASIAGLGVAVAPAGAHGGLLALGEGAEALEACGQPAPGASRCFALVLERAAGESTPGPGSEAQPLVRGAQAASTGPAGGLTPEDLASAYGFSPASGGSGQTVGIVDAYDDPSIESDLDAFDAHYSLPECTAANGCLKRVGETGGGLPPADGSGWSLETALDVETVHATCPNCRIVLVEATSNKDADLSAAANEAVSLGATVESNSYGGPEDEFREAELADYDHPGVPIVASTGDLGWDNWNESSSEFWMPNVPASLPSTVAVGGTRLQLNVSGARSTETVWNNGTNPAKGQYIPGATGGGCSFLFRAQPWQRDVAGYEAAGCAGNRLDADVSAVADPKSGLDVYDTYDCGVKCNGLDGGWETVGGTSLSAPFIASLYALAGGGHGLRYPSLTLYGQSADAGSRFDVTQGGNGFCEARPAATCGHPDLEYGRPLDCEGTAECDAAVGFDGPSGVGTPKGLGLFESQPPTAAISAPASLTAGTTASFGVTGFSDAYPGGSIAQASWDWGDGTGGAGLSETHTYASAGTYAVKLTVTDSYGLQSASTTRSVEVAPAAGSEGPGGTGGGGGGGSGDGTGSGSGGGESAIASGGNAIAGAGTSSSGASPASGEQAAGGVANFQASAPQGSPSAHLADGTSLIVRAGVVTLEIACTSRAQACAGTVTLQSSARRSGRASGAGSGALALGSASFTIASGKTAKVALHLSRKAQALLARLQLVHALARIALRGSSDAAHLLTTSVTIRPGARHRSHR